jgi:hypothetical protein
MALEQWEIDLRKQLEGRINSNKPKPGQTWEDKLVEEIEDLPQVQERKAQQKANNTLIMLVLLIVLGVATLFAYDSKSGGKIQAWIQSKFSSTCTPQDPSGPVIGPTNPTGPQAKSYDTEIAALRADIQRVEADNKANMDKMAKKVEWNSQRITLMGMLLNENFMIVRNNYNKGHLIFFNRDWTLDQMPHYLELSDEDREYLKKYVKPGQ